MNSKAVLRRQWKAQRDRLSAADRQGRDAALCRKIQAWLETLPTIGRLFGYLPFGSEPDLRPILALWSGRAAVPKVGPQRSMQFHAFSVGDLTAPNRFGIEEPLAGAAVLVPEADDVILVPALALDRTGYRLGYGGGFYDTYFDKYPKSRRVGIAYEEFIGFDVAAMPHDIRVQWIASERGVRPAEA